MKKLTLLLAIAVMFSGCAASFQKQKIRAEKFYNEYPNEQAAKCAEKYPVQNSYIKGKDSIRVDTTIITKVVKVPCPNSKDTVICPQSKTIIKTILRTDTVVKVNTAQVDVYRLQNALLGQNNEKLTKDLENKTSEATKRLYWIIGLAAALTLLIGWNVYRFFSGGAIKGLV